jgi:hypothetical protein
MPGAANGVVFLKICPFYFSCPAGFANERWFSRSGSHDTPQPCTSAISRGWTHPPYFPQTRTRTHMTHRNTASNGHYYVQQAAPTASRNNQQTEHTPSDMDDHDDSKQPRTTMISTTNNRQQTTGKEQTLNMTGDSRHTRTDSTQRTT